MNISFIVSGSSGFIVGSFRSFTMWSVPCLYFWKWSVFKCCLYPMQSAEDSTKIRILEIYASEEAYQSHLKTDHFQQCKQGRLHMVNDLKLPMMKPLDPETMKQIFKKQR